MIKRFRFLRMCAPAPHNLPYIPTQNKSLHHAPHPAVVPVPYSHRHRRAKFWRTDSKSFCRFCAAAVPRDRQTGSRGISRSAHLYKLHFVSFVVRSATLKKTRNGGNFRDRMCNCNTVTRDAITITTWSGLRPDTQHLCVSAQCDFWFSSASSSTRSLRSVAGAAASGVTSRMLLVIPLSFFRE